MVNFFEPLTVGISQLRANTLRSILSLVGILIAVGSVTGIVSIGDGLQNVITKEFEQMGGFASIWSFAPNTWYRDNSGRWVRRTWEEHVTERDIEAMVAETDKIDYIVPNIQVSGSQWAVRYRSASVDGRIRCTSERYLETENMSIARGRFITAADLIRRVKVCVLGSQVAEDLFGKDIDPLDREVKIQGMRFTVIGVLEPKEFFDNDYNDRTIVPITTAQLRYTGNDYINWIQVVVKNPQDVDEVADSMRRVYRRLHEHGDEFTVRTGVEEIAGINKVLLIMKVVAGSIAGISLLVGGIGIMNIMLVSVTERTREIGIRKSLGATRSTILWQFMIETVVLCLFGGLLGVVLGFLMGQGIAAVITSLTKMPFTSVISPKMMGFAVGFSLFVGIIFGVYPAWSASRLDPVEALRHD